MSKLGILLGTLLDDYDQAKPRVDIKEDHHGVNEKLEINGEKVKFDWWHGEGTSNNVIWFFGGLGSDEMAYKQPGILSTKEFLALQGSTKHPENMLHSDPHVFCLSFDKAWLISSDMDRRRGERDAVTSLVKGIIENIEKRFVPEAGKRIVMGPSMGGHNSLMMWLHHPEMWDGAVIHNPVLRDQAAYDSGNKHFQDILIDKEFSKRKEEYDNVAPHYPNGLALLTKEHPPIQLHTSIYDEFVSHKAAMSYGIDLVSRGVNVEVVKTVGGHPTLDEVRVADFINNIFSPEIVKEPEPTMDEVIDKAVDEAVDEAMKDVDKKIDDAVDEAVDEALEDLTKPDEKDSKDPA